MKHMPQLSKTKILPYTPAQMYALVANVPAYPDFLPYCSASGIKSEIDNQVDAFLELDFHGMRKTITTCNTMTPEKAIAMRLIGGPLDILNGQWQFEPHLTKNTQITLDITYSVQNPLYQSIVASVIGPVADQVLQAFEQRAEQLYG